MEHDGIQKKMCLEDQVPFTVKVLHFPALKSWGLVMIAAGHYEAITGCSLHKVCAPGSCR